MDEKILRILMLYSISRIIKSLLPIVLINYAASFAQTNPCSFPNSLYREANLQADSLCRLVDVQKYKVIFWGEQHNDLFDPELKYHLLTTLHKNYGFRHVFIEAGFSAAWLYNQYLKTGDTALLQASPGYRLFWQRIYVYNQMQPDSLRMVFHGIDFERTTVFRVLSLLAPQGKAVPAVLQAAMGTVNAHLGDKPLVLYAVSGGKMMLYDNSAFEKTLKYLQSEFSNHTRETEAFFGSNYPFVNDIVNNKGEVTVQPKPRNKTMYDNMERTIKEQRIEKFIGFFGNEHTDYSVSATLPNRSTHLPGIENGNILNISSVVYNRRNSDGAVMKTRNDDVLKKLNGNCKATIHPAGNVPGYKNKADYVVIVNLQEYY